MAVAGDEALSVAVAMARPSQQCSAVTGPPALDWGMGNPSCGSKETAIRINDRVWVVGPLRQKLKPLPARSKIEDT